MRDTIITNGELQSHSGAQASALLHDADFMRAWERLADACPWTTVYQMPGFAHTWYRIYADRYEPLVITLQDDDNLLGMLLLARDVEGGDVVHVGAHHAEYQGWLATQEHSAALVAGAAKVLREMGVQELRLHMASPKLPLDSLRALEPLGMQATVHTHDRGLMRVGAGNDIENSLKKKGNKSRISRLSKNAPLELVQLNSREELDEVFDAIIEQCDLRQGAVNNSLPFRGDPRKRDFYLAMMDEPGLLHATVLRAGDKVLAAHLGPIDRDYVSLGLIAHSPLVAAHSPGKLLLLFLGRLLGRQGFSVFDLTPGGSYKDRFADRHEPVPSVTLHLSPASYLRTRGRQMLVRGMRSVGDALGVDAREQGEKMVAIARRVAHLTPKKAVRTVANVTRRWTSSTREFRVYTMSHADALALGTPPGDFAINRVSDLLQYQQSASEPNVQGFLKLALQRLEAGELSFTCAKNGLLLHNSWLIPRTSEGGSEYGHHFHFAEPASVLWADFTHPSARGQGLHQASIRARAWYAARQRMASVIAIGVRSDNAASRHNIEKVGFKHVASSFIKTSFGQEERWIEGDFLSLEPVTVETEKAVERPALEKMERPAVAARGEFELEDRDLRVERMEKMRRDRERAERERVVQRANESGFGRLADVRDDADRREESDAPRL